MTKEKVMSLMYKKVQYNVGDIARLRPMNGITNPAGTIMIRALHPPDMVTIGEVGTEWVSTCSLGAIVVVGKPIDDEYTKMFEKVKDKDYLTDNLNDLSRLYDSDIGNQEPTVVVATGEPGVGMGYRAVSMSSSVCTNCGRHLTAPRSVACGYGPTCYMKLFGKTQPKTEKEKKRRRARRSRKLTQINYGDMVDARDYFR